MKKLNIRPTKGRNLARLCIYSLLMCTCMFLANPASAQGQKSWLTIIDFNETSGAQLVLDTDKCEYRLKLASNSGSPFLGDKNYYFANPVIRNLEYPDGSIHSQYLRFPLNHESVNMISYEVMEYQDMLELQELHSTHPFPRGFELNVSLGPQGIDDLTLKLWNYSRELKKFLVMIKSLNQSKFALQEKCSY